MRYEDESDSSSDEFEPEEEFDSDISKTISISESKNSDNITTDNSIAKINHVGNKQESSTAELKSSKAVHYEDESDSYSDEESESEEEANDENSETIETKDHVGSISGKLVNNLQENVITEQVTSARITQLKMMVRLMFIKSLRRLSVVMRMKLRVIQTNLRKNLK